MKRKLLIIGAGGHARSVIDIIFQDDSYSIVGCIDTCYGNKSNVEGMDDIPIIGNDDMLQSFYDQGIHFAFVALGSSKLRRKLFDMLEAIGYENINVISKHSVISRRAKLGKGICVMPGAVINVNSVIGDATIVNTSCSIDHDCTIFKGCHIAPGVTLSGTVTLGEGVHIGTGASVIDGISIGAETYVGGGAVVVNDLPSNVLAVGVPAKVKR